MRFPRFCMTTPRTISCLIPLKKVTSAEETLCKLVRSARFLNRFEGFSTAVTCLAFRFCRRNDSLHCSRFWKDVGAIALKFRAPFGTPKQIMCHNSKNAQPNFRVYLISMKYIHGIPFENISKIFDLVSHSVNF